MPERRSEIKINVSEPGFTSMRGALSMAIADTFRRMLERNIDEGKVTLTVNLALLDDVESGSHGSNRIVRCPVIKHKIKASIIENSQTEGRVDTRGLEVTTNQYGEMIFREYGSKQMSIFNGDDNEE